LSGFPPSESGALLHMSQQPCFPKTSLNSDKQRICPPSFQGFCKRFVELIDSPTFGESRESEPLNSNHRKSPASRELQRTHVFEVLHKKSFLEKIYRIAIERERLESERQRVPVFEKEIRPNILDARRAHGRLATAAKRLRDDFLPRYQTLLGDELKRRVGLIIEQIEDIGFVLQQREKLQVSRIHPVTRRKGDKPSNWELLLKDVDYDLEKISVKAPEQWFYEQVYRGLTSLVPPTSECKLTQMTRLKLISAICDASGIGRVEPTTVKQFLRSRKHRASTDLKEN
jgi:hypothetical protein